MDLLCSTSLSSALTPMPELYLIRHGIAANWEDYPKDKDRPLTEKGRQKTQKMAQSLLQRKVRFDCIFTSPFLRALQTAEILAEVGLSREIEPLSLLTPGVKLGDWQKWWKECRYNKKGSSLSLVGHEPDLGNLSEQLLWGRVTGKIRLKKAGIVGIVIPEAEALSQNTELFLLVSPRWMC